ncbi:MAG: HAMP domain-containing histidine kinase [Hydrogenobacter thermophilus]|uniref:sensor histidine kinase n=1 Tax=Hydrogenobacter thermophilus TaxID=940 RepID=UPI001C75B294|nr:HAMP domain-containing sensor histidine kinase [Hydrogenobacter thermophilus]QWK19012.1 MAG: HAMP domain-containing histidine kinase [Hydrogenobacter thermophilus]
MKKSLKLQLVLLLGFLVLLLTAYHVLLYLSVEKVLFSSVDRHMAEDAKAFELSYFSGKGYEDTHTNYEVYTIRTPDGLVLDSTENVLLPFDESWRMPDIRTVKYGDSFYRVLTYRRGDGFYVQYAVNFTSEAEFLKSLKLYMFISWSSISLLIVLTYLLVLRSVITSIRFISDAVVKERLEDGKDIYQELKPLLEKIRDALHRLKALSERQKNVILGLSHSIKTPLSTAILLLEDTIRHSEDVNLKVVRDELWRLERNVSAFLRMSKMENQQNLARIEKHELLSIMKQVFHLYDAKSGRVRFESAEESIYVLCDRDILLEVLNILMDNALTHSLRDSFITLRVVKEDLYTSVCIENLAEKGIDEEKLFKPFEGRYTGIGLYMAHKLSLIMNCKLRVYQQKVDDHILVKVCVHIPLSQGS